MGMIVKITISTPWAGNLLCVKFSIFQGFVGDALLTFKNL